MEFLKTYSGKGVRLGDALHIAANLGFVVVLALLTFVWQLPLLALVLAIFSKWRILAVRPRYWGINLRSNALDLIFIISVTALMIHPLASIFAQALWLTLLAVWLLALKPQASQPMMLVQAGTAQFIGMTALMSYAVFIPLNQLHTLAVVVGAWAIGYAIARHAISSYESEPKIEFFALLWGVVVAELTWLFSHWLQVYTVAPGLEIPQIALLLLLLSFCAQRAYWLQRHIIKNDDAHLRKVSTKRALKSTYAAGAFAMTFIAVILLTTNWTITI